MRIAINTRLLISGKMEGIGWYTYEVVKHLIENHPEDEFILFFDRKPSAEFDFGPNAKQVILSPQARHPILFRIWFNWAVKRALKKYQPDVFFSPDGYLSLTTDIPQVPVIHDLNFEHHPEDLPDHFLKYYKTYFPKFANIADHILTVSDYSKRDIIKSYKIPSDKITVVWNGASDIFSPMSDDKKDVIRQQYTNGKDYFLFVGALHPRKNLRRLIEAYTLFKEEHTNSETELVIVGADLWKNSSSDIEISPSIRDMIHFTGHLSLEDLSQVMGAANAFVFVPYFEGFGIPLVEAMKAGVPIITGNKTSLPEVAGEAALYCDPFNAADIAQKMNELATDEILQADLIQKGLERSKLFSWDKTAKEVY
ncbi:MAG: glycosyltransferase family 4 protein, partial [Crocinitomicaceae bacterium]